MGGLDAIEARANAATPGPWAGLALKPAPTAAIQRSYPGGAATPIAKVWSEEDAAFIAAARSDVPWLVGRVRDLEQAHRDLREMLKAWGLGDNDKFAAIALGAFLREFGKAPALAASGEEPK